MKKVFVAIVFISVFTFLSNTISQATSLEAFSFSGSITEIRDLYVPGLFKVGDTFVGQLSYIYDPMLQHVPGHINVFSPQNFFNFYFENSNITGSADFTYGYEPAGYDMTFYSVGQMSVGQYGSALILDDFLITIGKTSGSISIIDPAVGLIYGSMDNVNYSSIPMNSQPVPEPATMLLFGIGLVGLAGARLRKKK